MRIALVYFKDPLKSLDGMDTIRWLELSRALAKLGYDVEMVTEEGEETEIADRLRVRHIRKALWDTYDIIKTTHHTDVFSVPEHPFLICRIGRVVDPIYPQRVSSHRQDLLDAQELIARRAKRVVFMSEENLIRWNELYPTGPAGLIVPNGCPSKIPPIGSNPYDGNRKRVLYLGSLTSSRFVNILNALGKLLKNNGVELHHVGRNQLDLYGETNEQLDSEVVSSHGPVPELQSWNYLYYADVGVMIARGIQVFDNEISKVYYYLRAGLPTVSEQFVSTNTLIKETGWGEVVSYGDITAMFNRVMQWLDTPQSKRLEIGKVIAMQHSWGSRAEIYHRLFQEYLSGKVI